MPPYLAVVRDGIDPEKAQTRPTAESELTTAGRTKIVCTLGPATRSYEAIRALVEAGMDVARFNFFHGRHERATYRGAAPGRPDLGPCRPAGASHEGAR